MAYTTINKSSAHFNTATWTGNNTARSITGVGHQPDLVWIKSRTQSYDHALFDAVRDGHTYYIETNTNSAEITDAQTLTSMNSDGFSLGTSNLVNQNVQNHVAWNWKANGTGAANTAGSINSTVSVNTTAGFSIVKYTGTGSAATVGHGLGVKPDMIFSKPYSTTGDWNIYHDSFSSQQRIKLNSTGAVSTNSGIFSSLPTSTLVNIGTSGDINANGTSHLFYCFNSVKGYSKFGKFIGNGNADGPFIYTGFKPAFVMLKNTATTSSWEILDNKRNTFNSTAKTIFPDGAGAEYDYTNKLDLLSNGFKLKSNSPNGSGNTIIYMAFAEAPLVGSNNVPCTAR